MLVAANFGRETQHLHLPGAVKKTLLTNSGREITGSAMTLAPSEVVVLELA